jgi:6-phosphogluconolactonase
VAAALLSAAAASGTQYLVYAGAYTSGASRGIYGYRFDTRSGKLKSLGLLANAANPTFLVAHPDRRFLYAVNETGGSVSAYLIAPKSGKLSLVNQTPSRGDGPCHLALDREGRWLAVANCASGSVAILPLRKDGGMGEAQAPVQHQGAAHPRCVLFSPDNRFVLVADPGLDRIYVYRFDAATGSLAPAATPYIAAAAGAGVGYLAFHPNGRVLYAGNQTRPGVTAYRYNPDDGGLTEFQTVPTVAPSNAAPGAAAEVAVNAAGNMVYATNRGADSMALLVVDPVKFTLSLLELTPLVGRTPSYFALDPSGAYLLVANWDSGTITVYTVHPHTGQLRPAGRPPHIDRPACLVIVPPP